MSDAKKKKPVLLFLLVIAVIVTVSFIVNYRSNHVQALTGPAAGVERLSTHGDRLIAISREKDVYGWDWNDLSAWPKVGRVDASRLVGMSGDRIAWIPSTKPDVLMVSNLQGEDELERLRLGGRCKWLEVSPNGKSVVAGLRVSNGDERSIKLVTTDSDFGSIVTVATIDQKNGLKVNSVSISNDGAFIVAVGKKDGGWIVAADVQERKTLWEKTIPDTGELNNVVFGPNGRLIYASEPGRFIYVFIVSTGELIKKFEMDKYNTPPNNTQTISCIAVSPDGLLLAAATEPASNVWIWDTQSGEKHTTTITESFTVSGVAFSPESSQLATSIMVRGTINIWKISGKL